MTQMQTKILITGDFCPIGRNLEYIKNSNYSSLFGPFINIIDNVDYAITNLESAITESRYAIEKPGPNIKLPIGVAKSLKQGGFNLVTLANNHILDYGAEGIQDTLNMCEKNGIKTVGAGSSLTEARKPYNIKLNNKTIAIINIAENEFCTTSGNYYGANPLNVITNHYDIKEAKKSADYVIVISHGGREHYQLPSPQLRERYRFFVDSGADVVVGHHTHTFSGFENYNGKNIFYSLGNFIFDYKKKYQKGLWTQGYGVILTIREDQIDFDLIPFNQGREKNPKLELLKEKERKVFDLKIKELNNIISNDELLEKSWSNYIETQKKSYKANLFIQNKYIRALISKGLLPEFYFHSKKHKTLLLNLFRCETHKEIMIDVLKENYEF